MILGECERQKSQQVSEGATRTERMELALTERVPASNNNIRRGVQGGTAPRINTQTNGTQLNNTKTTINQDKAEQHVEQNQQDNDEDTQVCLSKC